MQILLNNREMDIRLENEENLGEVYESLSSWVHQAGMYPLSLFIDSQEQVISENADWKPRPLDSIDSFNLHVGGINSLRQRELMTVLEYFLLIQEITQGMREGNSFSAELAEACSEYRHVRRVLPSMLRLAEEEFTEDYAVLDKYMSSVPCDGQTKEWIADFNRAVVSFRLILIDRLQEIMEPHKSLISCVRNMESILPKFEDTGLALQTGEDKEAYTMVIKISEYMAKFVRIIDILSIEYSGEKLENLQRRVLKMGNIIQEASTAIQNNDSVILADIIEYDLHDEMKILIKKILEIDLEAP